MLMYDALGVLNNKAGFGHNQLDEPIKDREVEGRSIMFGLKDKEDMKKPFSFRVGQRPPIEFRLAFLKNVMEVLKYRSEWEQEGFSVFGVVVTQRKDGVKNG